MLATTPNIGVPGYPLKRSKGAKHLVHIWHSLGDYAYAWYHKGGLDHYDEALTAGLYMHPQIRLIEQKRNLSPKKLVVCGMPYLDEIYANLQLQKVSSSMRNQSARTATILIASSWGNKNCLLLYGIDFINKLAKVGYSIIVRPHPQSLKAAQKRKQLDVFQRKLAIHTNIIWDFAPNGSEVMNKVDLLISDVSSVRMDFALLYCRPVVTLEMPLPELARSAEYEYPDLCELLSNNTMEQEIGYLVRRDQIDQIEQIIQSVLAKNEQRDFASLREKWATNFGVYGAIIADYLIKKVSADHSYLCTVTVLVTFAVSTFPRQMI